MTRRSILTALLVLGGLAVLALAGLFGFLALLGSAWGPKP